MFSKLKLVSLFVFALFVVNCGSPPEGLPENEVLTTGKEASGAKPTKFRVETVASKLEVPWGFAFLPNGNLLFTERPGRVRLIENAKLREAPVFTVPDVESSGESGLMDISIHPDFAANNFVYLAYAYDAGGKRVRVVRYKFGGDTFIEPKTIIENIDAAQYHAGTRARFGPDGKLYITTGDATDRGLAQEMNSINGKTLRLNDDGTIPPDNPFVGQPNVRPEIWSTGHRNAQGLAWTADGAMFQTEHGPSGFDGPGGGDEVNFVEKGKNYGWAEISHTEKKEGLISPLLEYTPAVAPASALIYRGKAFPEFKGNLFFGNLRGENIIRVRLNGTNASGQERLLENKFGRIREVAESPEGYIYFSTSNRDGRGSPAGEDDRIMRIVPVK